MELQARLGHFSLGTRKKPCYMTTAAKTAMRGTLDASKRAVPHLVAHKVASTVADAAKKRKRVDIDAKRSQEPKSKKAFVDTGGININLVLFGLT